MKPQLFALLTAIAWGVGGYFEKKGMHLGNLSAQVGITIRTAVALLVQVWGRVYFVSTFPPALA
jgi:transporter family protein